jgi:transcriptional repressor NrdR
MYDRTKVQRGIMAACNKRNVDTDKIERIINELESEWAANKKGITSKRIGKDVLQKLKDIDEVAYIRFASIYLNFE